MAATYIWPNIRALLIAGFSEDELRQFCFDTPDFKPLYAHLPRPSSPAGIADQLIEYADQKLNTELLLAWAAEKNPAQFEVHQPYRSDVSPDPLAPGPSSLFREIKIKALTERLKSLMADYEAANSQLNRTLSEVDRNRLKSQVESLGQEMAQVENQLRLLR